MIRHTRLSIHYEIQCLWNYLLKNGKICIIYFIANMIDWQAKTAARFSALLFDNLSSVCSQHTNTRDCPQFYFIFLVSVFSLHRFTLSLSLTLSSAIVSDCGLCGRFQQNRLSYWRISSITILKTNFLMSHIFVLFSCIIITIVAVEWDFDFKLTEWRTIFQVLMYFCVCIYNGLSHSLSHSLSLWRNLYFEWHTNIHIQSYTKKRTMSVDASIFGRLDLSMWVWI